MECLINPQRRERQPVISGTVLLCITPNEAMALSKLAKDQGWQPRRMYPTSLWAREQEGGGALYGPAMGAPMAVMALEQLIALGGQRFVVYGSCGALSATMSIGDVLLPTWAVSQEGTSRHYPVANSPKVSPHFVEDLLHSLGNQGFKPMSGGVWTTDAPYRERRESIRRYQGLGVKAVDMELSALLAVASFRKVELAAVMVVSDLLNGEKWQPGFGSAVFKRAIHAVGRAVFNYCGSGNHE